MTLKDLQEQVNECVKSGHSLDTPVAIKQTVFNEDDVVDEFFEPSKIDVLRIGKMDVVVLIGEGGYF